MPLGVGLSVGSAISGIATWIGDSIASSVKSGWLNVQTETEKSLISEVQ